MRSYSIKRYSLIFNLFMLVAFANAQNTAPAGYSTNTLVANYVRTWDALVPDTNSKNFGIKTDVTKANMTTQYIDGLGRPVQAVIKQGSLATGTPSNDMVNALTYDEFGRQPYQYFPFAANHTGGLIAVNDGSLKINPFQQDSTFNKTQYSGETWYYGQSNLESSSLSRTTEAFAPGNSWVGTSGQVVEANRRSVKMKYWFNKFTDSVRIWTVTDVPGNFGTYSTPAGNAGIYPAGKLYKNIMVDEHGKQVVEFTNKQGLVVLKKVQLTALPDTSAGKGHSGWLCTYYIYDSLSRLRCMVQPRGVELIASTWLLNNATILAEQCFRYEYDQFSRLLVKKIPGAGRELFVYDARNRLIMTQDSLMRTAAQKRWLYTKYDSLNRPIITGWITDNTNYNNLTFHQQKADTSVNYPNTGSYPNEELTRIFYDNYDWRSTEGNPLTATIDNTDNTYRLPPSASWPYTQTIAQSAQLRGRITGSKVKLLGTSTYLYRVNFYDERGRMVQIQSGNVTSGTDITTMQYSWNGQPLLTIQKQNKAAPNAQTITMLTQFSYDSLWRISKVEKKISHSQVSAGAMPASWKTIVVNEYDALGQLKKKKLAPAYNNGTGLDSLTYDYNIRGWQLGVNRSYVKDTTSTANYFGYDLGYDKTDITINGLNKSYSAAQYNGGINGMLWRSKGDGQIRKYDFTYDAVNRLTQADFNQFTNTNFNKDAQIDFSVKNLSYDANGNILAMNQRGWKLGGSQTIDSLLYTYTASTNKLLNVWDRKNDTATRMGDFRSSKAYMTALSNNKTTAAIDYTYDVNGNLTIDKNKDISIIRYNHLNLPDSIVVTGKGTIKYQYDATGNKIKKTTIEGAKTTITLYMDGSVYRNDTLELIRHEGGRVRKTTDSLVYDYMLTDHLGNVRMVLTEEKKQDKYPVASLETAKLNTEDDYYTIDPTKIVDANTVTGLPAYTNDNGIGNNPTDVPFETANSLKLYKLNSGTNKTGLGITLKVMSGDRIDIHGKSYYFQNNTGGTAANSAVAVLEILSGLVGGPTGGVAAGAHGGVTGTQLSGYPVTTGGVNTLLSNQTTDNNLTPTVPKAYINYLFFDEQFKCVGSGFSKIGANSVVKNHFSELQNLIAPKNGYVYIYCSNESPVNVFFDNLQVVHKRSPILEETHYYPFGLTIAGISSQALAFGKSNNYKFNSGTELSNREFIDGSGLELYETPFRGYDPQIGRFWQIDPLAEITDAWSPYAFAFDNPIFFTDPSGLSSSLPPETSTPSNPKLLGNVTVTAVKKKDSKPPVIKYDQASAQPRIIPKSEPSVKPSPTEKPEFLISTGKPQVQESSVALSVRSAAVIIAGTATLFYTILTTDYTADPSMPLPGFLVRDNATYNPPIPIDIAPPKDIPIVIVVPVPPGTPTRVYEIGGWDVLNMKWQTLKYGVATSNSDTYGGEGNRRPDGQLGGKDGEALRNKYPGLVIRQVFLATLPSKPLAHIFENNMVVWHIEKYGYPPPEQYLPTGIGGYK